MEVERRNAKTSAERQKVMDKTLKSWVEQTNRALLEGKKSFKLRIDFAMEESEVDQVKRQFRKVAKDAGWMIALRKGIKWQQDNEGYLSVSFGHLGKA